MEMMICPKSRTLVDATNCIALKSLSKPKAELFARKICTTVSGCPKSDYIDVFEAGWDSVSELIKTIEDDK